MRQRLSYEYFVCQINTTIRKTKLIDIPFLIEI